MMCDCYLLNKEHNDINLKYLLYHMIKTEVVAINLGENSEIIIAKPIEAIMFHLEHGGKIRRYYLETNFISKKERREAGLFTALKNANDQDKQDDNRDEAKILRLSKEEWKAVDDSGTPMGYHYVKNPYKACKPKDKYLPKILNI